MIGLSFFLYSFGLNGIIAHLIPLMTDRQFDVTLAALAASIMGTLIMFSRAGVGLLLDYFFAPYVAIIFFLLGASGLLILALGGSSPLVFLGAVLVGSGIGAQTNIMSFLIGRHFGLVAYGTIYGYMYSAFIIGASVSPLALGLMFEVRGSYNAMLYISAGIIAVAAAVISRLGPYPNLQADEISP
jgi:MFS family permease